MNNYMVAAVIYNLNTLVGAFIHRFLCDMKVEKVNCVQTVPAHSSFMDTT